MLRRWPRRCSRLRGGRDRGRSCLWRGRVSFVGIGKGEGGKGEGDRGRTDVGEDTGDYDLLLACGFEGCFEV